MDLRFCKGWEISYNKALSVASSESLQRRPSEGLLDPLLCSPHFPATSLETSVFMSPCRTVAF